MPTGGNQDLTEAFIQFFKKNYEDEIDQLARRYPDDQRSLRIDYDVLLDYDRDLAHDYREQAEQIREFAEEALRLYNNSMDENLGVANVRIENLPETIRLSDLQSRGNHIGTLVAIEGIVRYSSDVQHKVTESAFECQRCGTLTYIPQPDHGERDPHQCQGCEGQGPFRINADKSEFIESQTFQLRENPEMLSEGETPDDIEVRAIDDVTGVVAAGDRVRVNGVVHLEEDANVRQENVFTFYMDAVSIESLDQRKQTEHEGNHPHITDLNSYVDIASTTLGSLPEEAREEETKAKLITPFIEALGWNKYDSTETRLEYTDSKTEKRPDYALFGPSSSIPDVIVEAKQLGTNLDEKEKQLYDYLRVFSAEWGVLTNGEDFYVYHRPGDEYLPDKLAEMSIEDLSEASIVDSLRRDNFYE